MKNKAKKYVNAVYRFVIIFMVSLMILNVPTISANTELSPIVDEQEMGGISPTSQNSYWKGNEWLSSINWENLPGSVEYLEGIGDYSASELGQRSAVKITQIGNGQMGGLGLDANGKVWTWGYNLYGELGIGVTTSGSDSQMYFGGMRRVPFFIDNNINVIQIQGNYQNRMALDDKGNVYTWGHGAYGQMGNGTTTAANPTPKKVTGLSNIVTILSSNGEIMGTNYAIDKDGNIWGWGYNSNGQLGIGSVSASQTTPTKVMVGNTKFVKMSAGDNQLHAIDVDGNVWNAGYQYQGRLGNGKTAGNNSSLTKMQKPSGMGKIIDISSSYGITVALDENGQVWHWGPVYGQGGGTGTPTIKATPERLSIDTSEIAKVGYTPTPVSVFAGESVSYFIDHHGRPWAWGSNRYFGLGREGGYEDSNDIQLKSAQQWPKVIGDGDTQIYDRSTKTPFSGLKASGRGGYGFNDLHPSIYDEKYKNSDKDMVWKELSFRNIPKVSQIVAGRSTYTLLDDNGNIYKWGNDGSGSVAWGWDYDSKYDQNGSKKDGLYDRYLYEVVFMRGMPIMEPMNTTVEKSKEKIYIDENNPQVDKIKITTQMPSNFSDKDLNLSYTHELQSIKYIVVPYDTSNEDFKKQELSEQEFRELYESGTYKTGSVLDEAILSEDKAKTVVNEIEVTENCKVFIMTESKGYSQNPALITSYIADNFYTPTTLSHVGNGYVDGSIYEEIYQSTQENIEKLKTAEDTKEKYGIPMDANGEVIENPSFGYDKVRIKKYDTLPNGEDKYWLFMLPQEATVDVTLDDKKYVDIDSPYIHEFKYERNPSGWVTLTYRGVDIDTDEVLPQFTMTPTTEIVKIDKELVRTPPMISDYDILGYHVNTDKTIYDLDDSHKFIFTPTEDTLVTFLYGTWISNANKKVVDDNGDGFASSNEGLSYTLTYTNDGSGTFKNAEFKDSLEHVLPYVKDTANVSVVVNNNGAISTKTINELINGFTLDVAAKSTVTVSFKLYVKDVEEIGNSIVIKNKAVLGDTENEAEIEMKDPILDVKKVAQDATGDMIVSPGEEIYYSIHGINVGEATGSNLVLKDTLDKLKDFIDNPSKNEVILKINGIKVGNYTVQDLMEGIVLDDITPNTTIDVSFVVKAKNTLDVTKTTQLENTAFIGKQGDTVILPTGKANLTVEKSVSEENQDGVASPGELITYVLSAQNNDSLSALNIVFKDDLAFIKTYLDNQKSVDVILELNENKTIFSLDDLMNGNIVVEELKPNEVATVTFEVRLSLDVDIAKIKILKNTAVIDDTEVSSEIETGQAELVGDKQVQDANGDHFASPKEELTYTITISNTGKANAINPVIKDDLANLLPHIENPDNNKVTVDIEGVVSSYTVADLMKGIQLSSLNSKETAVITFSVVVKESLNTDEVLILENIATINDTPLEPGIIDTGKPSLETIKNVVDENKDGFASSNEELTYMITTTNTGKATATNVLVKDTLEDVLPYIKDIKDTSVLVEYDGNVMTKTIQDMISGFTIPKIEASKTMTITFKVQVKETLDISENTVIKNTIMVGDSNGEVSIPLGDVDLSQSGKIVSDQNEDGVATAGERITYTIYATNTGLASASDVVIKDELKEVLKVVDNPLENTVIVDVNGVKTNYKVSDLIDGILIPTLNSGESVSVTFTVRVKDDLDDLKTTKITNIASIGNEEVEATIPTGKANIISEKLVQDENGDGYASNNEILTYTITSQNKGITTIDNFEIKDELTDVLPYVKDPRNNVVAITYNEIETTITVSQLMKGYTIDKFNPNDKVSISFQVQLKDDIDGSVVKVVRNKALINNEDIEGEIPFEDPNVTASKTVTDNNGDRKASPKEELTYTLKAENKGNADYSNFLVKDELKELLPYIENPKASEVMVDNAGAKSTYTVEDLMSGITISTLKSKTTLSVTFKVIVNEELDTDSTTLLKNIALLGKEEVETSIDTGRPQYDVNKTVSDENHDNIAVAGETLTYVVVAKNTGNATGSNFVIKDELTHILPYINNPNNNVVTLNIANKKLSYTVEDLINGITVDTLAVSEEFTLVFDVVIKTNLDTTKITSLKNVVIVGDSEDSTEIPTGQAEIGSSKSVKDADQDGKASPGEVLTYVLEATNNGNASVYDFEIKDELLEVLPHVDNPKENKVIVNIDGKEAEYTVADLMSGIVLNELKANSNVKVRFTVVVKKDLDVNSVSSIKNVAIINGDEHEKEIPTGKAIIEGSKQVSDKNGDGKASPKEELTYIIEAKNIGTANYPNFVVKDDLSDLIAHIENADDNEVVVNHAGVIKTYKVSDLKKGITIENLKVQETLSVSFKVVVKEEFDSSSITYLRNMASLADKEVEQEIPTGEAILVSNKHVEDTTSDNIASPSEVLKYKIVIANVGNAKATNIVVKDDLAQMLSHIDNPRNNVVVVDIDGTKSMYKVSDLMNGITIEELNENQTAILTFEVNVIDNLDSKKVTKIENVATVNDEEVGKEIPTGISEISRSKKSVDTNGDNIASPSEEITYVISATNNGVTASNEMIFKDELTDLLSYIKESSNEIVVVVESTKDSSKNKQTTASELIAGLSYSLGVDETIKITFKVTIKDDFDVKTNTVIRNVAQIGEENVTNEIYTGDANITSSKAVKDENRDGFASSSEILTYTIIAKNNGNVDSKEFLMKDDLKELLAYIEDPKSNEVTMNLGGTIVKKTVSELMDGILIPTLSANQEVKLEFSVKVRSNLEVANGTLLKNTAIMGDTSPETSIEVQNSDIEIAKEVSDANGDGFASANETLTYTLKAHNVSTINVKDFIIKDTLVEILPYIENPETNSVVVNINGVITSYTVKDLINGIVLEELKAQESVNVSFTVKVKDTLDTSAITHLKNIATLGDKEVENEIPTANYSLLSKKEVVDETGDNKASPGESLTYTITTTNQGPAVANDIVIKDDLENLISIIDDSKSSNVIVNVEGQDHSYTLDDLIKGNIIIEKLAVNESVNVKFTVKLIDTLDVSTIKMIKNVANIDGEDIENEIPTGSATLLSKKSVIDDDKDGKASASEKLTYKIVVENIGTTSSGNTLIKDDMRNITSLIKEEKQDIEVSLVSSHDENNVISYTAKDLIDGIKYNLQPNEKIEISFTVTLIDNLDTLSHAIIENIATINDEEVSASIETGTSSLELNKTVVDESGDMLASPKEELTYNIRVSNTGGVNAKNVVVKDTLEHMLNVIDNPKGNSVTINSNGTVTTHSIDDLMKGIVIDQISSGKYVDVTFKVRLKETLDTTSLLEIRNIAVVDGNEVEAIIPTGEASIVGTKVVSDANGDGFASPKEELTYTLTAENIGSVLAKDVEVKDEMRGVLSNIVESKEDIEVYVTSNTDDTKNKVYTASDLGQGLRFALSPNEKITITFKVTLSSKLNTETLPKIDNLAIINGEDVEATIKTGSAKIESSKTVVDVNKDGIASPKETMTYTISARNTGNVKSDAIEIKDSMALIEPMITSPLEEIEVSVVSNQDASKNTSISARELANGISYVLQPNEEVTISFTVIIKSDLDVEKFPELVNTAIVGEDKPGVSVPTGKSDIVASKSVIDANNDGIASPSEELAYTIVAKNNGTVDEKDIVIKDTMDQILLNIKENPNDILVQIQSDKDNGKNTTVTASELINGLTYTMLANEEITISFNVTLRDDLDTEHVKVIKNMANVAGRTPEVSIVTGKANVVATKTANDANGDGYASPHETINYELKATNTGSVVAKDIVIRDTLDELLPYIENSLTENVVLIKSNKDVTKNQSVSLQSIIDGLIFDIESNETVTVNIEVTLKNFEVESVPKLKNIAAIGEHKPSVELETKKADFISNKQVIDMNNDGIASLGEELKYVITASNITSVDAKDVIVQDTLSGVLPYIKEYASNIEVHVISKQDTSKNLIYSGDDLINGFTIDIAANETIEVQFKVTVRDDLDTTQVSEIFNEAVVADTSPNVRIDVEQGVYEVIYNANGYKAPNIPIDSNVYGLYDPITILGYQTTIVDDQKFLSWNTEADGSGISLQPGDVILVSQIMNKPNSAYINSYGVRIDGTITLYAIWEEETLPPIVNNPPVTPSKPSAPATGGEVYTLYALLAGFALVVIYGQKKYKPFTSRRRKRLSK